MELQLSLFVIVHRIYIFHLDKGRNVFDDFCDFGKPIFIDNIEDFFVKELNKVGISLIFNLGVSLVDSIELNTHLLDEFLRFGVLQRNFDYFVFSLNHMNYPLTHSYIQILILVN